MPTGIPYASPDDRPASHHTRALTKREWREMKARWGHRCAYCGRPDGEGPARLCIEHTMPRSRGGEDEVENIVPACRGCNNSKGDLTLLEWVFVKNCALMRSGVGANHKTLKVPPPCLLRIRWSLWPEDAA